TLCSYSQETFENFIHLYEQILLVSSFFEAEYGIQDFHVTGVQTCALPISCAAPAASGSSPTTYWSPRTASRPAARRSRRTRSSRSEERRVGNRSSNCIITNHNVIVYVIF